MPAQERVQCSAMTGQSLFYMGETDRSHKILAIAEEGARSAAYARKLLQSEGELRFASQTTRTRRDHLKYLTLIRAIAVLHQHQREVKEVEHHGERIRYIEVTDADVAIADRLASHVLGADDLPPHTRVLLEAIDRFVEVRTKKEGIEKSAVRFGGRSGRHAAEPHAASDPPAAARGARVPAGARAGRPPSLRLLARGRAGV